MSQWRGTYSHDGGALSNQGIHHIDLLRYLGGEIDSVNCTMRTLGATEVEDTAIASIKYRDGSVGTLEVTTAARPDDFEASLSIVGSEGLVQLGGVAVNMLEIFSPDPKNAKFTVIVFMIYLTEAEYMVEATWKCIEILLLFIEIKENFQ